MKQFSEFVSAESLSEFITKRLTAFMNASPMWGCNEAVELQAVQLIEIETLLRDGQEASERSFNAYTQELNKVTGNGSRALSAQIEDPTEFGKKLFEICTNTRKTLGLI